MVRCGQDGVYFFAGWSERADRVGGGGVTGEEQGLAAAAAEVQLTAVAGSARLLHPVFTAKFLERVRRFPNLSQTAVLHILEVQCRDDFCGVAGKRFAAGGDEHELASPAAHAGL